MHLQLHASCIVDSTSCLLLRVITHSECMILLAKRQNSSRSLRAQQEKLANSHGLRNGQKSPEPMDGLNSDSDHSSSPVPNGSPLMAAVQTLPSK